MAICCWNVKLATLANFFYKSHIRRQIVSHLQQAADYEIASKEKTSLAKTVRTCRQLLSVEGAMWLFVTTPGVEPTNNAAERAIRPAVIWRRTSFGSRQDSNAA